MLGTYEQARLHATTKSTCCQFVRLGPQVQVGLIELSLWARVGSTQPDWPTRPTSGSWPVNQAYRVANRTAK